MATNNRKDLNSTKTQTHIHGATLRGIVSIGRDWNTARNSVHLTGLEHCAEFWTKVTSPTCIVVRAGLDSTSAISIYEANTKDNFLVACKVIPCPYTPYYFVGV